MFLNVWSPPLHGGQVPKGKDRLPVMVWIHPGANVVGAGADFDSGRLAVTQNVIVVTINYRLGVLGWFHHPALAAPGASTEDRSGNFGTLDQIEALKWVRRNIAAVGGDPRRVTVFGESAGGWNIFALLASPKAAGLFHRAIIQSGNAPFYSRAQAVNFVDDAEPGMPKSSFELLAQLLIDAGQAQDRGSAKQRISAMSDGEIASFLRSRSFAELLAAERALYGRLVASGRFIGQQRYLPGLVRDGSVLPHDRFLDTGARGAVHRVPVMLGSNRDEDILGFVLFNPHFARRVGPGTYLRLQPALYDIAVGYLGKLWKADGVDEPAAVLSRTQPVYAYRFDWDEQDRTAAVHILDSSVRAMHGMDVPLVFGTPNVELDAATRRSFDALSEATMSYWAEFAYHGSPGRGRRGELLLWPEWRSERGAGRTLVLDSVADGGIRAVDGTVTVASVLAEIARDPRLPTLEQRCRLYYELVNHPFGANHRFGRLTAADYTAVEGGACAAGYPLAAQEARARASQPGTRFRDCDKCPAMTIVPAGSFEMGVDDAGEDERPRHRVTIARDFAVGVHEVTRGQFAAFVAATGHRANDECNAYGEDDGDGWWQPRRGRNWRMPGFEQTDSEPVVCVSWTDAQAYVGWLSRITGQRYRLLSESEWEYVATSGGIAISHDAANYGTAECCGPWREGRDVWDRTAPVGSFAADALGLYDVAGNVWEWTQDCYHPDYIGAPADGSARTADCPTPEWRTLRGGSYGDGAAFLRPSYRLRAMPANAYFTLGFRVARDVE